MTFNTRSEESHARPIVQKPIPGRVWFEVRRQSVNAPNVLCLHLLSDRGYSMWCLRLELLQCSASLRCLRCAIAAPTPISIVASAPPAIVPPAPVVSKSVAVAKQQNCARVLGDCCTSASQSGETYFSKISHNPELACGPRAARIAQSWKASYHTQDWVTGDQSSESEQV